MHIYGFVSMLFTLFMAGCEDKGVNPPPPTKEEKKWEEIELFKNTDVRYIVQHNGILYIAGIVILNNSTTNILYKTEDGVNWDTLKTFERTIGPIAFHEDTLTILESGRTWKFHPSIGWKMFWQHLIAADHTYDMFWLSRQLYVFDKDYGLIYSEDTVKEMRDVFIEPSVSKFFKHKLQGKEIFYTRPFYVYEDKIYRFNGISFEVVMNGISLNENTRPNYPAICVKFDTLYAGFNSPSRIKKLVNDVWINIADTIPNTPHADFFSPQLINRPTSIVFQQNQLFVGTEWTGVLKWTDAGWVSISKGLRKEFQEHPQYNLYSAVVQFECFREKLFVAYGAPWYAPGSGKSGGVYKYSVD